MGTQGPATGSYTGDVGVMGTTSSLRPSARLRVRDGLEEGNGEMEMSPSQCLPVTSNPSCLEPAASVFCAGPTSLRQMTADLSSTLAATLGARSIGLIPGNSAPDFVSYDVR